MKNLKPYLKNQILKPLFFVLILSFSVFFGYEALNIQTTSWYLAFFISLFLTLISLLDLIFIFKRIQPILKDLHHIYDKNHSFAFQEFKMIQEAHELLSKNKAESLEPIFEEKINHLLHDLKFPLQHLKISLSDHQIKFYNQVESLLNIFKEDFKDLQIIHLPEFLLSFKKDYSKICTLNLDILDLNLFIESQSLELRRVFVNIIENFIKRNQHFINISLFKRDDFIHGKISGKISLEKKYPLKKFYQSENIGTLEFESFFKKHHGQFKVFESDNTYSYHFSLKRSFPPKDFSSYLGNNHSDFLDQKFYPDFIHLYQKEAPPNKNFYLLDNDFSFSSLFTQFANSKHIDIFPLESVLDSFYIPDHSYLLLDYHLLERFSTLDLAKKLKEKKYLKIYILTGDDNLHNIPSFIQGLIYKKDLDFLISNLTIILNSQKLDASDLSSKLN